MLTDDVTFIAAYTESTIWLNPVLKTIQFPTGIANLYT